LNLEPRKQTRTSHTVKAKTQESANVALDVSLKLQCHWVHALIALSRKTAHGSVDTDIPERAFRIDGVKIRSTQRHDRLHIVSLERLRIALLKSASSCLRIAATFVSAGGRTTSAPQQW